jgi:hypothetical protein
MVNDAGSGRKQKSSRQAVARRRAKPRAVLIADFLR